MAKFNLHPPRRHVKHYSTRSTSHHIYSNQIASKFPITQAHQVWCSDLSRIVYRGSIWYLATIEDIATRQVIAQQIQVRTKVLDDQLQSVFQRWYPNMTDIENQQQVA